VQISPIHPIQITVTTSSSPFISVIPQSEFIQIGGPALVTVAALAAIWFAITAITVPGLGFPELGTLVSVIAAAWGLLTLPTNPIGAVLLALAMIVFFTHLYFRRLWPLAIVGFILQILGSVFLFQTTARPPLWLIALIDALTILYFFLIIRPGLHIQDEAKAVGPTTLMGAKGQVVTTLDPIGTVRIQGTIWRARSNTVIPGGTWVEVIGRDGLMLEVTPSHPDPIV